MNLRYEYIVVSGEGETGTHRTVRATRIGIKRILTKERCNSDRWCKAFRTVDCRLNKDGQIVCPNVETGEYGTLPEDFVWCVSCGWPFIPKPDRCGCPACGTAV